MGGWVPESSFSDERRRKVADVIGVDRVKKVERVYRLYRGFAEELESQSPVGKINQELRKIRECATVIADCLKNSAVREEMKMLIQAQYPASRVFLDEHGNAGFLSLDKNIQVVLDATASVPDGPGRPPNSKNYPEWFLLYQLYPVCRDVYGEPLPIADNGTLLHDLVDALGVGTMPEKIKKVIKECQS